MAWTIIDSASARGTTPAINTTGADLLIMAVSIANNVFTGSDSQSNTWSALTNFLNGTGVAAQIAYVLNPTTNASHTFSTTQSYEGVSVIALSGAKQTSPFDQQSGDDFNSSTSYQIPTVTPSETGELVIAVMGWNDVAVSGLGIDGGFTIDENLNGVPGNTYGVALAHLITGSAQSPTFSWTTAVNGAACLATFKVAGGGGAPSILTQASYHLKRMKD